MDLAIREARMKLSLRAVSDILMTMLIIITISCHIPDTHRIYTGGR